MPSKTYLSRMIIPFVKVLTAKRNENMHGNGESSLLKYIIFNLHDTNISNYLRFLGYWDKYGYDKQVKFASSVRMELIRQRTEEMSAVENNIYKIRIVYDDEEI